MGNTTDGGAVAPEHTVNITEDFYAGVFEVTQHQWLQVMGSYPTGTQNYNNSGTNTDPVHYVSWEDIRGSATGSANWYTAGNTVDANTFMGNLLAKTGLGFDLPTEAEWEYSCRAGTATEWSYGNTENGDYMWYMTNNTPSGTKEVGGKLPNPWGLYDIHGNVNEWCLDWYDASYYSSSPNNDPFGSYTGTNRIIRGGYYSTFASSARSAVRSGYAPTDRVSNFVGFRLFLRPKPYTIYTPPAPQALTLTAGNTMLAVSWESTAGSNNTTLYWSETSGEGICR